MEGRSEARVTATASAQVHPPSTPRPLLGGIQAIEHTVCSIRTLEQRFNCKRRQRATEDIPWSAPDASSGTISTTTCSQQPRNGLQQKSLRQPPELDPWVMHTRSALAGDDSHFVRLARFSSIPLHSTALWEMQLTQDKVKRTQLGPLDCQTKQPHQPKKESRMQQPNRAWLSEQGKAGQDRPGPRGHVMGKEGMDPILHHHRPSRSCIMACRTAEGLRSCSSNQIALTTFFDVPPESSVEIAKISRLSRGLTPD
ncbi:hypothetical protein CCHR01_16204 [Colletotrichum chrysophilum]|uniref:Uncharacterized protein n=1 Tax=Colletotrichum chrysophilum TaxID=1836956 RepID=A0AAD9EB17_9PEZI|nr:hypothetical protein CCHR01_16204 [Colletotrichum chrysophilum]